MLIKKMNRRSFLKLAAIAGVGVGTPLWEFLEWRVSSAAAQSKAMTAAYSNNSLSHSWCAQGKDAVDYFGSLMNIKIDWQDQSGDPNAQLAIFNQFAANAANYDFVGVQPVSIGTLVEPITTLIKAGKPVVAIDTLIAPLKQQQDMGVLTFMSCDNIILAEGVCNALAEKIGRKGSVAHIGGDPGHSGAQGRQKGFHNVFDPLAASGAVKIVEDQPANWLADKSAALTQTFLTKYPDLVAIFYDNDDMAVPGLKAVQDAGREKTVFVGGLDAMPPAIQLVAAGQLTATARNSANRVHSWSVIAGAWAATVGLDNARGKIPQWLYVDGPIITVPDPVDPKLVDTPWLMKSLGIGTAEGSLWLEENHLM
ncbi:MAG: sugar ABC transporter substrate-binding protein [Anaerolineae bacterium]|nr:sugar ABC transporter substrate-binding protein [Anaerolineae bacterium]